MRTLTATAGPSICERFRTYAGGERVLKTAVDSSGSERHTVYIFGSLELRRAAFEDGEYERTSATMAPYLRASGVRLARLYYSEEDIPTLSSGHLHVLLELADHLGSSSFVIDKATSELVEATRYEAYGATESDYRPERWKAHREEHRFTGKEEDIEVGLTYFGARYYSPALNRWTSADPLAVHAPGEADLNLYAYVHGQVLRAVDPLGLQAADLMVPKTGTYVHPDGNTVKTTGSGGPPTPTPDAPAGGQPTTPMGHAFKAGAEVLAGQHAKAAESLGTGVDQIALQGIPQSPVPGGVDAARSVWNAGKSGGIKAAGREYGQQLLSRTPVVGAISRARAAAKRVQAASDPAEMAGAVGDTLSSVGQAAVDVVSIAAGVRAAVKSTPKPPAPPPETRIVAGVTVTPKGKPAMTGSVDLKPTLDRIRSGGSFPHRNDGSIFMNKEGLLPKQPAGYYREYVHPTPEVSGPGPQRVITGQSGELYYTPDHYQTFIPVN